MSFAATALLASGLMLALAIVIFVYAWRHAGRQQQHPTLAPLSTVTFRQGDDNYDFVLVDMRVEEGIFVTLVDSHSYRQKAMQMARDSA